MLFSKRLHWVIIGYVGAILLVSGTGIALIVTRTGFLIGSLLLGVSLLIVDLLVKRLDRFNARVRTFLDTIEDKEHMVWFHDHSTDPEMNALSRSFNRIHTLLIHARAAENRQEAFYHSMLDEIPHGIVAWDDQYRILYANRSSQRLLGIEPLCLFRQLEQSYPVFASWTATDPTNRSFLLTSLQHKQLALSFNTLKLETATITLLAVKDISRELNEKENESWLKLTRILTHEIMNTIAPIVSLAQSLAQPDDQDPKRQRKLRILCQQSERLRDFTVAYRQLYSLPAPQCVPFSLTAVWQNLRLLLQPDLERAHIQLHAPDPSRPFVIDGDEKQWTQVFLNLIRNSMQALEGCADGHITLTLTTTDTHYIRIADNGRGIPAAMQEKIFIPFFTTKADGTGIGLPLCRQIVKQHHGHLYLQHSRPRHTVFVIELPRTAR